MSVVPRESPHISRNLEEVSRVLKGCVRIVYTSRMTVSDMF